MSPLPPGAYRPAEDRWGPFPRLARALPEGSLVVVDRKVARLHPALMTALRAREPRAVVPLTGGEGAKSFRALEQVLAAGLTLPRSGTLLAIGGGTVGDVSTVAAHLLKRGVRLVQVPSTLLAAVDSSLGGKGAVDLTVRGRVVKNPAGVFHYADEAWVCPELFTTLTDAQRREGAIEAWKMVVCLDAALFARYLRRPPALPALVRDARRLKESVCAQDPYEQSGLRRVLNFGHSFGHVLESLSAFRLSHGDAVGLGMLCALDAGRALGVTPPEVATQVEEALTQKVGVLGRAALARFARRGTPGEVRALLAADKKAGAAGQLRMVLLTGVGSTCVRDVEEAAWRALWPAWTREVRP
ncbi:3-dehydroquinate synthase [Aggregicoccus sp. 17bor-14]|uniref:3-dehydroquinate synthase n=1 Tax=Myxococcaceae TaxID=31 RepID=UPI00129CA94E|nr:MULTISPECIES: 3-dehydroquinate synthase family protein [Myxococcaceae]MBF5043968.1 3-dehydroquinate synthase [Simulacricoccus sp. 17bor-14]MRI89719.1 3-dehydroquinate synthase [Aggregicoccus sp. 17bor-14]